MNAHHGQIIEKVIRRNGYSISELARLTKVNRRSVYNWFNQRNLKSDIIYRIGSVLNYDFSNEFPDLFINAHSGEPIPVIKANFDAIDGRNDLYWKDKYIQLLEKYNDLLIKFVDSQRASGFNPDIHE